MRHRQEAASQLPPVRSSRQAVCWCFREPVERIGNPPPLDAGTDGRGAGTTSVSPHGRAAASGMPITGQYQYATALNAAHAITTITEPGTSMSRRRR